MPIAETEKGEFAHVMGPIVPWVSDASSEGPITTEELRYDTGEAEPYKPVEVRVFRVAQADARTFYISDPALPAGVPDPRARWTGSGKPGYATPAEALAARFEAVEWEADAAQADLEDARRALAEAEEALKKAEATLDGLRPWTDEGIRYGLASNWREARERGHAGGGILVYRLIRSAAGRSAAVHPDDEAPFGPASLGFSLAAPTLGPPAGQASAADAVRQAIREAEWVLEDGGSGDDEDDRATLTLLHAWLAELGEK